MVSPEFLPINLPCAAENPGAPARIVAQEAASLTSPSIHYSGEAAIIGSHH